MQREDNSGGTACGAQPYKPFEVRFGAPADDTVVHELDANEVLDIALRFEPYAGRFMYHCHILEHEDRDMMRPIVVTPKEVMDSMSMPGMNGSDQRM